MTIKTKLVTFILILFTCIKVNAQSIENQPPVGVVVHGLHKSATLFIHGFFGEFCGRNGIKYFSINSGNAHLIDPKTIRESFVIAPIRSFKHLFPGEIKSDDFEYVDTLYHIYQVRDPRDVLVSEYFSFGWTHGIGGSSFRRERRKKVRSMTIDEYVIHSAPDLKERMSPLVNRFDTLNENEYIVKYEEMVLDFRSWVDKVLKPFKYISSNENQRLYNRFAGEFKARPEKLEHKRKVIPGDHKEKLKPETIQYLNEFFQRELEIFNYTP